MADDIPGVARKIGECLVVATVAEARRRKWSKWWPRRGKRKKHSFFSLLWLLISPLSGNEIQIYL
jgi:hypothetical protein